jgi:predicted regulator of Ras-like GTPase activity (Roadblock/LC7/MglB family)
MDASAALDRLTEISAQIRAAVVFERGGKLLGSTLADEERAQRIAAEAAELLAAAERRNETGGASEFAQLEAALQDGSVFVVRHEDRLIAATTPPEPTVGLVFYDLKSCLRELEEPSPEKKPAAKRTTTRKTTTTRKKKTDAKS